VLADQLDNLGAILHLFAGLLPGLILNGDVLPCHSSVLTLVPRFAGTGHA
jgi:hypothetical protein